MVILVGRVHVFNHDALSFSFLQLCLGAFLLTIGAFLVTAGALLLAIEALLLTMGKCVE